MYLWQLCKWQCLLHFGRFSGVTFCDWYLVDLSVTVIQLTVSVAVVKLEVSAANMCLTVFIVIMQMGVSVAIMQVVFSAVHYAHDCLL